MTPDMTLLDRMVLAVERVRDRLKRASGALEAAGIPYAVAGGNAVAAWVATVDAAAVRNTQDVDILLRRADLEAIPESAQKGAGPCAAACGGDGNVFGWAGCYRSKGCIACGDGG